jgi:LysM repeat protein
MNKWIVVFFVLFVACLVLAAVGVLGLATIRRNAGEVSDPVVDIYSPRLDDLLLTGQPLMLQAVARDPDGVTLIEFWLDGNLTRQEVSPWEKGITPLPLAHATQIDQAGQHILIVRAFDTRGNWGQSSMILSVAQGKTEAASEKYVVQEEDTLEGMAEALGIRAEDIAAANPEMGDELPPAGEEIVLPPPAPEEADDAAPPEEPAEPPRIPPDIFWERALPYSRWLLSLRSLLEPSGGPPDLLDIALLESDSAYDGVHCYVSAGDSPVVRVPSSGFLSHLSGNYWDIAEWFSGGHMLPFLSADGEVRLRMNCVGFYSSTAGGIAYDLGTLDVTRRISEVGTLIDERATGAGGWFRIQFRVQPLSALSEGSGMSYDALSLDSTRWAVGQDPLLPNPHVILEYGIYDEGRRVPPPVMDGYLIYRNGSLWRTAGPSIERYVVWDHILEAGGCGQQSEFFVVGFQGNPLSPTARLQSNRILITGYCPLEEQFKKVTVQFNWLSVYCLDGMERSALGGLITGGTDLPSCGMPGEPECILEDVMDTAGCPSALDNFGPVSYGGLDVNGHRVINMPGVIQFTPRDYYFLASPWNEHNRYELTLGPDDTLTISTTLWDYDVWSLSDQMCPGRFTYSPEDLATIIGRGGAEHRLATLENSESQCALDFQFAVAPFYAPPPSVVP